MIKTIVISRPLAIWMSGTEMSAVKYTGNSVSGVAYAEGAAVIVNVDRRECGGWPIIGAKRKR
jgi:hypothetical protein